MRRVVNLPAIFGLGFGVLLYCATITLAAEKLNSPMSEQKEIFEWVDGCRRDDTSASDESTSSIQVRKALFDLEKRFLFASQRVYNERVALEAELRSDIQWVQIFTFVTFLVSLLAACFVSVNVNHFSSRDGVIPARTSFDPLAPAAKGRPSRVGTRSRLVRTGITDHPNTPPRWFLMSVILLPIISASLSGYVAIISPKDDAARLRLKLTSMTVIHKLMAASLLSQNCLKTRNPDTHDEERLAKNLDNWRIKYQALFEAQAIPGTRENDTATNSSASPP